MRTDVGDFGGVEEDRANIFQGDSDFFFPKVKHNGDGLVFMATHIAEHMGRRLVQKCERPGMECGRLATIYVIPPTLSHSDL